MDLTLIVTFNSPSLRISLLVSLSLALYVELLLCEVVQVGVNNFIEEALSVAPLGLVVLHLRVKVVFEGHSQLIFETVAPVRVLR